MKKNDGCEDFQERIFDQLDTLKRSADQRMIKAKIRCEHDRLMWEPCRKCRRNKSDPERWLSKNKIFEET